MLRPDGRLTHETFDDDRAPQDECGVFGVWAPGEDVAKLTYFGLYAIQHRGQESAGIATSNGERISVYKDMGLVSQVFDETTLNTLIGHMAVGHCRYSTTGGSTWTNAQPTLGATPHGTVALAHNGNLTNSAELYDKLIDKSGFPSRGEMARGNTTDTALVTSLLAEHPHDSLEEAALALLPQLVGSFCLSFMDEHTLYAARDPQGIRPLVLGRLERGRSSPASSSRSTRTACARTASPRPVAPPASSSTCTWPARTPRSTAARSTSPAWTWAGPWRMSTPSRRTWSCPPLNPARRRRSAMPRPPGSRSATAWSRTRTSAARSSSPRTRSASSASASSSTR